MWEEPTGRHCDVCDREKKPVKRWIEITTEPEQESGIDRVRRFISDTVSDSEKDERLDTAASEPTNVDEYYEETFYICPHLPCDGRAETIREIERWKMEHNPNRVVSEDKLDEIVAERVEKEKRDHYHITKAVDEAHEELLGESTETASEESTDGTGG